ncbi:cytochrome P450 [Pseudomaricurvus alcaniphilus]|nr:cytochrome P450 [Pseudomaricurvus alcaniphilus]
MSPPEFNVDMYADEVLRNPIPFYDALRDAGPVVSVPQYGVYAVGHTAEATEILNDNERFIASAGTGLVDIRDPGLLRPVSFLLESDPPQHTLARTTMQRIMSPVFVRSCQSMFIDRAEALVDELLDKGQVDGVGDIAEKFVLNVFSSVVGLELPPGPAIAITTMALNMQGPMNERSMQAYKDAEPHLAWFEQAQARESAIPGGIADLTYQAEDAGNLPEGFAKNMASTFLAGGFDSTIGGIGHTLNLLAQHPSQWDLVCAKSQLARAAFNEAIRLNPPFRVIYRMITRETEVAGYRLEPGMKIGVWICAVNRDPNLFERLDEYDITRKGAAASMSFGMGIHNCIGQMLARLEAESIISALAKRVSRIELTGEPEYQLHNHMYLLDRLPLRLIPA